MRDLWQLSAERYNGLPIRAACGIHDASAKLLMRHMSPTSGVIDLAAGSGAWLARLIDLGFSNFSAIELDTHRFELAQITPKAIDLNSEFSKNWEQRFTLITAIEIIEHLDSPRHFLKEVKKLLKDDGYLLLSTPNIAHWSGRIRFFLTGEHRYFGELDYHQQRHISPVSDLHMRLLLRESGFQLVDVTHAGTFFGPIKKWLYSPINLIFSTVLGIKTTGDATIYLARKTSG